MIALNEELCSMDNKLNEDVSHDAHFPSDDLNPLQREIFGEGAMSKAREALREINEAKQIWEAAASLRVPHPTPPGEANRLIHSYLKDYDEMSVAAIILQSIFRGWSTRKKFRGWITRWGALRASREVSTTLQ